MNEFRARKWEDSRVLSSGVGSEISSLVQGAQCKPIYTSFSSFTFSSAAFKIRLVDIVEFSHTHVR